MIITAVVSVASLVLSIVNYFDKRPHLKIKFNDKKRDCFYTIVGSENHVYHYISWLNFNIINDSPVKITINDVYLLINKEVFFLVDTEADYWASVDYLIKNEKGVFDSDGLFRDAREHCIKLPLRIDPYDSISTSALFNSIPNNLGRKVKAKIVFVTAIGTIRKKATLLEYGIEHLNYEFDSILQFQKSIVDIGKIKVSKDYEDGHKNHEI